MENNNKRLAQLIKFFDSSIVILILIMIVMFIASWIKLGKSLEFNQYNSHLRSISIYYSCFNLFKVTVARLFFAVLLWMMRQIIKSTLTDNLFRDGKARKMRQIARILLYFAGLMLIINIIFIVWVRLERSDLWLAIFDAIRGSFEGYVLLALAIFGIAEIFHSGRKLQEDQELTI